MYVCILSSIFYFLNKKFNNKQNAFNCQFQIFFVLLVYLFGQIKQITHFHVSRLKINSSSGKFKNPLWSKFEIKKMRVCKFYMLRFSN